MLSISFSSELNQSSVAVVLNDNGVVTDSLIIGQGGRIAKLESQTLQIQRNIEEMLQRVSVGE